MKELKSICFSPTGDRKKARVREMFEIVPEASKGNECSDRVAGSDRCRINKEILSGGNAFWFGCWSCLGQGNNIEDFTFTYTLFMNIRKPTDKQVYEIWLLD